MNEMKMIRPYVVVKVVTMTGLKVYVNVVKVTCSIVKITKCRNYWFGGCGQLVEMKGLVVAVNAVKLTGFMVLVNVVKITGLVVLVNLVKRRICLL